MGEPSQKIPEWIVPGYPPLSYDNVELKHGSGNL